MGRKNRDKAYESDENDSDGVDDILGKLKPIKIEGRQTHMHNGAESEFPVPSRLYSYDYITGPWMRQIVYRGIGEARAKAFLSELTLVNGSIHGGVETRWSQGHEFWEGEIQSTGQRDIFFSSDSIDELVNLLAEQVDQVPKAHLKPDKDRSVSVKHAIDRSTLRAFRPVDSEELRDALTRHKGMFFSLLLTQSRAAYQKVQNEGGTAFTLRSQRLDVDPRITIEVGWSYLRQVFDARHDFTVKEEVVRHRVIDEFQQYRNGAKIPDTRDNFGFPDPNTNEGTLVKTEDEIMTELEAIIGQIRCTGPVLLIVHDAESELGFFRSHPKFSSEIDRWSTDIPSNLYSRDGDGRFPVVLQDCRPLYASYRQHPEYASTILASACKFEGIQKHKMNNAGNDSYYLLQLFDHIMTAPTGYTR